MLNVNVIPQSKQRYPTVGDWMFDGLGDLNMKISDMKNKDYEFMVAIHEAIEAWLCRKRGISEESVTAFDTSDYGLSLEDPGSSPKAPYHKEHMIALKIEKILCKEMELNWEEYEKALADICPTEK